jgi:sec-independent protein translocase protein TatA
MFTGLGSPTHLLLILVVVLLLFGAKRLPELGRNLGRGITEFKRGLNSAHEPAEERPEAAEERAKETTSS